MAASKAEVPISLLVETILSSSYPTQLSSMLYDLNICGKYNNTAFKLEIPLLEAAISDVSLPFR